MHLNRVAAMAATALAASFLAACSSDNTTSPARLDPSGGPRMATGVLLEPPLSGNPTCAEVGARLGVQLTEFKVQRGGENNGAYNGVYTVSVTPALSITISNYQSASQTGLGYSSLDWQASSPVVRAVIMKAASGTQNVYTYTPAAGSDTDLRTFGGNALSHISFCYGAPPDRPNEALQVEKSAAAVYDRAIGWELVKTVDDNEHSGMAGQVAGTSNWSIAATKTETESGFLVTGSITIRNPNGSTVSVNVADQLSDGTSASVDCDPGASGSQAAGVVPAASGATAGVLTCTYTASPPNREATLNYATVTTNNPTIPGGQAQADVAWLVRATTGDETVTLADPRYNDYSQSISTTTPLSFPETFTCSNNPADYTNGSRTDTYTNVATLKGAATDLQDDAMVTVICTLPPLTATKTAVGTYTRGITWTLDKSVTPSSYTGGIIGQVLGTSTYTIVATKIVTESNHLVEGEITITNPSGFARNFTVTDQIGGQVATVNCGGATSVAANGGTVKCSYSLAVAGATLNTAVVSSPGVPNVEATAPITYTASSTGDETVTLADPALGISQPISGTTTIYPTKQFACSSNPAEYTNGTLNGSFPNTATLQGPNTNLSDDALVTYTCRNPFVGETATGYGFPWDALRSAPANWFMYTPWTTTTIGSLTRPGMNPGSVNLIAGQTHDVGDITGSGVNGSRVITITLQNQARFMGVTNNVKINPMQCGTSQRYVQPGQYSIKKTATVAQGTITVPVPDAPCYGIHVDVERYVP